MLELWRIGPGPGRRRGAVNTNGVLLRFVGGGEQTVWIQTREDGVPVDQIVVSPQKYRSMRPATAKNNRTILAATMSEAQRGE